MLVSPLMGPILAGLSLAASDLYLGVKSLIGVTLSISARSFFGGDRLAVAVPRAHGEILRAHATQRWIWAWRSCRVSPGR